MSKKVIKVGRSAIDGKFIKISDAKKHPKTTTIETITKNKNK